MAELPQKVEKVIRCDISGWQTHLYKRVLQGKGIYSNNVNGTGRSGIQMMNNDLMQLRKICNHPHIFFRMEDEIDEGVIMSSGKVHMLDRILPKLKAAGHRVLHRVLLPATLFNSLPPFLLGISSRTVHYKEKQVPIINLSVVHRCMILAIADAGTRGSATL